MKSILLTTTALVAFAGAAVADGHTGVSFSGSAELGYNNDETANGKDGFYWEANVATAMTAALDNGITAGAEFDFDVANDNLGSDVVAGGYLLSLTTEGAGLYFGDTQFAAKSKWKSAGDMESDLFSDVDGEAVLRGDVTMGDVSASVSYRVDGAGGTTAADSFDQLSIGVAAAIGSVNVVAAYQDDADATVGTDGNGDFKTQNVFGVSASTTVAGATVTVAYASNETADEQSTGIQVAYPVGPVTATVYYVDEDAGNGEANTGLTLAYSEGPISASYKVRSEQDRTEWNLEGSYDLGNGMTALAGMLNENEGDDNDFYVGGTYDLGGGASLMAVFAEDKDADQADEIGSAEYMPGTTVLATFSF